jgi:hypothetical protein
MHTPAKSQFAAPEKLSPELEDVILALVAKSLLLVVDSVKAKFHAVRTRSG